jgi:thioredoxin-dependent peroxiredoxin
MCRREERAMLNVGSAAPDFSLRDQSGTVHSLSQYRGKRVVLYFYPKDDTPDCTDQACDLRDQLPLFHHHDTVVLGISPDDQASHARFAASHQINFTLLADEPVDGTPPTTKAYKAWVRKSMFGRGYMGVVRCTYLIDVLGKIARVWPRVRVETHAAELLAALTGKAASEIEAKTPPMMIEDDDVPGRAMRKKSTRRTRPKPGKQSAQTKSSPKSRTRRKPARKVAQRKKPSKRRVATKNADLKVRPASRRSATTRTTPPRASQSSSRPATKKVLPRKRNARRNDGEA